jgi:hypothetical protein
MRQWLLTVIILIVFAALWVVPTLLTVLPLLQGR